MKYEKIKNCLFCNNKFTAYNCRAEICSHKCHLQRRRLWSIKNGDKIRLTARLDYYNGRKLYYKIYEKTISGLLMRMYRNMKSRVSGIQKSKYHLYRGKELLKKEEFYSWANNSKEFLDLFTKWKDSKYDRKLTPSVDRIDSSKGYSIPNMEWVTHSENSRRGSINRIRK